MTSLRDTTIDALARLRAALRRHGDQLAATPIGATIVASPAWRWTRANLLSTWTNAALTVIALWIVWKVVALTVDWALLSAVWTGEDGSACRPPQHSGFGACWPFVFDRWNFFMYGRYPADEYWRVNLMYALFVAALTPILIAAVPRRVKAWCAIFLIVPFPVIAVILLAGDAFGLEPVETGRWGGLMLTLIISVVGVALSLPIGIALALGRRSTAPIVRWFSIAMIEFWRGVPLITVLFMASVMLPLFLPEGVTFDKVARCLVGVTLFASAYMAEVVRGGLQGVDRGQTEAAQALGLSYWRTMGLIILPQALRNVIPGVVNTFIGLFKDTTLVLIVGLFDLLGIVQLQFSDPTWSAPGVHYTGYFAAGLVFWVFCFGMSRYASYTEQRLAKGRNR